MSRASANRFGVVGSWSFARPARSGARTRRPHRLARVCGPADEIDDRAPRIAAKYLQAVGDSSAHPDVGARACHNSDHGPNLPRSGFCRLADRSFTGTIRWEMVGLAWDVLRISGSRSPNGPGRPLGTRSPQHDDTLGVDDQRLSRLGFREPRELHDRPTRRVDDQSLDILGFALHATALAGQKGDLGYRGHDVEIQGGVRDATAAGLTSTVDVRGTSIVASGSVAQRRPRGPGSNLALMVLPTGSG